MDPQICNSRRCVYNELQYLVARNNFYWFRKTFLPLNNRKPQNEMWVWRYEVHTISFQTFFVLALLLIIHTWNTSPLRSNLLRLKCTCCTVPATSGRPHRNPLVWACQWPSSQPLLSPQLPHNDSLGAYRISKSHREQGLNYRDGEELSWCRSWSNSLWQGWRCGLAHCPGGNATDPIWRVLASSQGISCWTPLKPQHSNPNPLANQLWCIDSLTPCTSSQTSCLPWVSYATQKTDAWFMQNSRKAVWSIPYVSVAFFQV